MSSNSKLTLVIGDKNLSSWSMRPWLVLKESQLPFREVKIRLDTPKAKAQIARHSPSGRVPVLIYGQTPIWDSLAICEFIAELESEKNLWPADPLARATARSYVAEMHSGFASLRQQLSMDIQLKIRVNHLTPGTSEDIRRILKLWSSALQRWKGPFLFGEFGIADAFFAPVVMRFHSYGIVIKDSSCRKYVKSILRHQYVREWMRGAAKEIPIASKF
jgi:glutathione S-transferase